MKVNIEAQSICVPNLRGIPFYTANLIKSILQRSVVDCSISFFDFLKERNNIQYIEKYITSTYSNADIIECNSINYKDVYACCYQNDFAKFDKDYEAYLNTGADVFHYPSSPCFPYALAKNAVVTVHDIMPILFNGRHYWSDESTERFINCHNYIATHDEITVIADSECTKKDIIEHLGVNENRIFVTPLGYDEKTHFHETNMSALREMGIDSPYLLYLGALDMRKGIFDILKAFDILKSKYSELKLVISGKAEAMFESQYKEKLLGVSLDNVIFTGYVTDELKRFLLSSAEAFLFPSEYEGFGLPVLEAMACGAPVITTNISSLPEVGGDAVLYVSPNQPEELADQISKILDSSSLRDDYIEKGYERAKQFSWDKTAALTEEVYKIAYNRTH